MPRIRTGWIRRQSNKELDAYLKQRAWHWTTTRNYALAADYAIRLLNRHPRDPVALVLGEVAARRSGQDVFRAKCLEAQKRLCYIKDVDSPVDLVRPSSAITSPSRADLQALLSELAAEEADTQRQYAVTSGWEDEQLVVKESEPLQGASTAVRRCALRVQPVPLVELLEPTDTAYGRGLYAAQRIAPHTPLLADDPIVVQRMDDAHCAHCLTALRGVSGATEVSCPHCQSETYCSNECQEAAWAQYHACCCPSHNALFAEWSSGMTTTLCSEGTGDTEGTEARAALTCLAVAKVCAMATMRQVHPLALPGMAGLRGKAEYEPTTALSEVGALAVTLATALRQTHLYMEEILSLFALIQTNEFLMTGGSAVYHTLSFLNHSCEPNCTVVGSGARGRQLISTREIRDGEQLFIDYNSNLTTTLTYPQRKALCAQRNFECFCPKCIRRE